MIHELAHIDRFDALTQALARMLSAVFWFHPLIWSLRRSLDLDQERACDDRVLAMGDSPSRYARHLLSLIVPSQETVGLRAALPGNRGRRSVITRIHDVLDTEARHEPLNRRGQVAVLIAATVLGTGLVLGPVLAADRASGKAFDAASAEQILEPATRTLLELEIPGAVITMVKDGKVILSRGLGIADVAAQRAVDPDRTVFRIGSITKALTAIALLQVLDERGVALDHPVGTLAPGLDVPSASNQSVTFQHLLTHTGGFDQLGYGRHADAAYALLPLGTFLRDHLVAQRPPGSLATYDTYGITLAGHMVERMSGAPYADYVTTHIFRRLGMKHSGFEVPEATTEELAIGYAGRGDELTPQPWELHHTVPASSATSTGGDMAKLMIALLNDCQQKGKQLLKKATCRAMLSQQFANHPRLAGYGLGFLTDRRGHLRIAQHGGSMEGYAAILLLLPDEKIGLFVAANVHNHRFTESVMDWLLERLDPDALEIPQEPRLADPIEASRFTGRWVSTLRCHTCEGRTDGFWRGSPFEVSADRDGNLNIDGHRARPIGRLLFQRDDGLLVAFREGSDGTVSHMFLRQGTYERHTDDARRR